MCRRESQHSSTGVGASLPLPNATDRLSQVSINAEGEGSNKMQYNMLDRCPMGGMTFERFDATVKELFGKYHKMVGGNGVALYKRGYMLSRWQLCDNLIVYASSGNSNRFVDVVDIMYNGRKLTRRNMSEDELSTILHWILRV